MLKWFFAVLLLACPLASAEDLSLTLSGGYSHLELANQRLPGGSHFSSYFYEKDGTYVDGDVAVRIRSEAFPLQLGGGLSWFAHNTSYAAFIGYPTTGPNAPHIETIQSDMNAFSLEARVALPIFISGHGGFFVTPRLGMGPMYTRFRGDRTVVSTSFRGHLHSDFVGITFDVRPNVQFGFAYKNFAVGAEVSYMFGVGDFRPFGSSEREFRAGMFMSYRF